MFSSNLTTVKMFIKVAKKKADGCDLYEMIM